jgi:hypothetical protein
MSVKRVAFLLGCLAACAAPHPAPAPAPAPASVEPVHRQHLKVVPWSALPMTWAFECGFPRAQRSIIRRAFEFWNRERPLGTPLLFREAAKCGIDALVAEACDDLTHPCSTVVVRAVNLVPKGLDPDTLGTGMPGTGEGSDDIIAGVLTLYPQYFRDSDDTVLQDTVARHEVGHILGFEHDDDTCRDWCRAIQPTEASIGPDDEDCTGCPCLMQSVVPKGMWAPRGLCDFERSELQRMYGGDR